MPSVSGKTAVGRQTQMPFKRALEISVKSLRIRFWRSMITAGGIFLGIAFLTVVLTQALMQWPLPEKVDAGFVRVSGRIHGPGDYDAWTPIAVDEGVKAGIPEDVIARVADEEGKFRLAAIVQGKIDAGRADVNLGRVKEEWNGLKKIKDPLAFYIAAMGGGDVKVDDAVKYGVPRNVARNLALAAVVRGRLEKLPAENGRASDRRTRAKLERQLDSLLQAAASRNGIAPHVPVSLSLALPRKGAALRGSDLADIVRDQPDWINPLYSGAILDQDINIDDAVRCGVPRTIARRLAGVGKTFKAGPLNDAIIGHDRWMKIWRSRAERNAIFKTVPEAPMGALAAAHARTLNDVIAEAKKTAKDADLTNIMVVNKARKIKADFAREGEKAGFVKLENGDNIHVPDRNSRYRTIWLVVMSLLVCTVGITNSMLMSVTERFKEIGTMKCLGALDKFVVELFMLESGMMGIAASILGWVVGFLLMVLIAGFSKGWDMVGNMQGMAILFMFFEAIGAGLLLTIVATVAPAKRAADMPPAMALRSEI